MTNPAEVVGYVLAALLLPISLFLGGLRGRGVGAFVMLLAVLSHLSLAWLHFDGFIDIANPDNSMFQRLSHEFYLGWQDSNFKVPSSLVWSYGVSFLFHPFGYSVWLAYVVNAYIFLLLLDQLGQLAADLGAGRRRWVIVLIFAFVPSSLLNNNFLLRENFQILMLIIAVRHLEAYRIKGATKSLLFAMLAFVPFGMIHNGFYLFGPMALASAVLARATLAPRFKGRKNGRALTVLLGISLTVVAVALLLSLEGASRVSQILDGDIDVSGRLDSAASRGARTVLPWGVGEGLGGLVIGAPLLLIQFMFAPIFPLMINSGQDVVAGVDTAVRIVVLFLTMLKFRQADESTKKRIVYLLALYILFCLLAAVGTTTVGTAMRHHLKVFWIIILLGLMPTGRHLVRG